MLPTRHTRRAALFALIFAAASCDESAPAAPEGTAPAALLVLGGDGQEGVAGAELAGDLSVRVVDERGRAVPGAAVRFAVVSGGGVLGAPVADTEKPGVVRARWRLGTAAADSQVVEASVDGASVAPVRLRARIRPDAPAVLSLVGGSGAAGRVGAALADPLQVRVVDRFGNGIAGLEVAWQAVAGGGSVTPARALTGPEGIATAQWTLGPRVDSAQGARATVAGLAAVDFTANALTDGVPLRLAKRSGDGQQGPVGGVLLDSLGVTLRMADGRPVQGALVTWSVPEGAGTVTPALSRTDAQGNAAAVWRLGMETGLAQATAAVDSGVLVFTSRVVAGTAAQLATAGGDAGTGPVGRALPDSLAVRVTDAHGNPAAGAEVAWAVVAGGGSVQPERSRADSLGIARAAWILGARADSAQGARASIPGAPPVAFTATGVTAGAALQLARRGGDGQRGTVGGVLADSLGVVLRLNGTPVPGALVTWAVPYGGGTVTPAQSRTDAQGRASAVWRMGMTPGLAQATATVDEGTLIFGALADAGAPAALQIVGGNGGAGGVGQPVADSLAVAVTDAHGNLVRGAVVQWAAAGGSGSVSLAQSTTNAQGVARARWTLGLVADSAQRATATVAGLAPAAFTATAGTQGVTLQLVRRGGEGQSGAVGTTLADSLEVEVRTPGGQPVRRAQVAWAVVSGGGSISPASVRTDATGRARAAWTMGTVLGAVQASATVDGGTLAFNARTTAGAPASIQVVGGDGGSGGVGQPLADSLAVLIRDAHGNPVPGAAVVWAAAPGNGSVQPAQGTTGADGVARAAWTLGLVADSAQGATATVGGLPPAAFGATAATQGVPLLLARRAGEGQSGERGAVLADSLEVEVRTQAGEPVRRALVGWAVVTGGGSVAPASVRTDAAGRARAAWTLGGSTLGAVQAAATLDGGTLLFNALAVPGAPAALQIVAGNGETGGVGQPLADSLGVRVTDAQGRPVPGVAVSWAAGSSISGSVSPAQSTTNQLGIARTRWTLGLVADSTMNATAGVPGIPSVTFLATAVTQGVTLQLVRRAGDGQSGETGTVLPDSLEVEVRTLAGQPVHRAQVVWSVTAGGGSVSPATVRTNALGRARAAWTLGSSEGAAQATARVDQGTLTFSATQTSSGLTVTVVSGNGQTATRGTELGSPLTARVTNAAGAPVANVWVDWPVLAGGGFTMEDGTQTDANGMVSAHWALGYAAGANQIAARVAGADDAVFSATGVDAAMRLELGYPADTVVQLWPVPGSSAYAYQDYVVVYVLDPANKKVYGAPVRFEPNNGELAVNTVTAMPDGDAVFTWRGRMREYDTSLPRLRVVSGDQEMRLRAEWDSGARVYVPYPSFLSQPPFAANTTVMLEARAEELNALSVPEGLPMLVIGDNGWRVETVMGATVGWPVGPQTGARTLTVCAISQAYRCEQTVVQVQ